MRISDWSSDVCSSDLDANRTSFSPACTTPRITFTTAASARAVAALQRQGANNLTTDQERINVSAPCQRSHPTGNAVERSEEHTSELQSLMRISYADFCLKTKIHSTASTYTAHPIN